MRNSMVLMNILIFKGFYIKHKKMGISTNSIRHDDDDDDDYLNLRKFFGFLLYLI